MAPLLVGERHLLDDPARLGGVVVLDRRLEMLPQRHRLAELASEPAEEADARSGDGH
jgi:hypothetical protein